MWLKALNKFFTPFEKREVVIVELYLQDLTFLCVYQYQYHYLFPQIT